MPKISEISRNFPGARSKDGIRDVMMEAHVFQILRGSACEAAKMALVAARLRQQADLIRGLKQQIDSIRRAVDGVVLLDLACLSSRQVMLAVGPASAACTRSASS